MTDLTREEYHSEMQRLRATRLDQERLHGNRKGVTWSEWTNIHNTLADVATLVNASLRRGALGEDERVLLESQANVLRALAILRQRIAEVGADRD